MKSQLILILVQFLFDIFSSKSFVASKFCMAIPCTNIIILYRLEGLLSGIEQFDQTGYSVGTVATKYKHAITFSPSQISRLAKLFQNIVHLIVKMSIVQLS